MKKLILSIALMLGACQWMMAETVDEFLQTMKTDTTLEYVEVMPDMMKMMLEQQMAQQGDTLGSAGADEGRKMMEHVNRVEILSGKLPADFKTLKARLAALTVSGADEMVNSNEGGELSRVWMLAGDGVCRQIVVVQIDPNDRDWGVIKVDCDIPMDENFNLDDIIQIG